MGTGKGETCELFVSNLIIVLSQKMEIIDFQDFSSKDDFQIIFFEIMLIFSWARFAREFQIIIFTNKYF